MKYLPQYYNFLKTGKLKNHPDAHTNGGLCSIDIDRKKLIELFRPDETDGGYVNCYWAYGETHNNAVVNDENMAILSHSFTPLRQNILLLMAAMNNEL